MNAKEFMTVLYKGVPADKVTYLFTRPDDATYPYTIGRMDQMLEKAIRLTKTKDVYFGLHLMDELPPPGKRSSEEKISCMSFIHEEYDVKGPAHKEQNLPETLEELLSFLHGLECPPSIIVHSGNGVHTYWLLQEYITVTDENRGWIKRIVKGYEKHTHRLGMERGWKFDPVADLARVLRIPGTLNHKSDPPKQAVVIEANLMRYPLSAFEKHADTQEEYSGSKIPFVPNPALVGPAQRIINGCKFIQHCRDDSANLPEPAWYAMVTNVAPASDGVEAVHELSAEYGDYSIEETDRKIKHALEQNKPHGCQYIRECLGFDCPAGGCGVKAPVVFSLYTKEERVHQLMEKNLTAEDVFAEDTLSLMAYAKEKLPGEYGKFKLRLRRLGVSLRDFERAVIRQADAERTKAIGLEVIKGGPISLPDLDLHGAVEPEGFSVSLNEGIQKTALAFGDSVMIQVASEPVVITRKLENVDDSQEKLEITFRRNGRFKSIRIPRSAALNKTQLIRYADSGLPVNPGNAEDMVSYLAAYEAQNNNCIPCIRSIDRIGWVGKEFYPYRMDGAMELETDAVSVSQMIGGLTQEGTQEAWLKSAEIVRAGSISREILAGSFASPLLHWLKHRVFLTHAWHDSRGGKTATLKLALSVWGDPVKLLTSYHATAVGLERSCAAMMHLPLGLDELQALTEKRMTVESIVYSLGNGFGKLRGAKNGGLQKTLQWRNIILSTGEMPLIRENSMDGVGSRVLELYGRPITEESTARELHQVSERNYGHAGKRYIEYLIEEILSEEDALENLYRKIRKWTKIELSYVYIPEQEKKGCGMMKLSHNALIRMVLFLIMLLCAGSAHAEYVRTDTIHESLPQVTIRITDTGVRDESYERENLLRVSISTEDHSIAQELSYSSSENAGHDGAAALARLEDVNFDGYQDLLLLTAQGARNVFYAVSVYHPDENRFMPVLQTVSWETEIHSFNWEKVIQLELCNEELHGEKRLISSSVADGYQFLTEIVYQWQGGYTLEPVGVSEIYDAGSGMIGEVLEMYATGIRRCWDEQYPEEWYYGQEGVYAERRAACRLLTLGDGVTNPEFRQVANVDWVNLRRQDSKSSPSLARLDAGTPVQVLGKSAVDDGWIRVFLWPEGNEVGMTGYIWHSYLE